MRLYVWLMYITSFIFCYICLSNASEDDLEPEGDEPDAPPIHLDTGNGGHGQSMSFKPPDINEEEQHSNRIPSNLRCDGCMVVAYQLGSRLQAHQDLKYKKKPGKFAPESEVIDLVEDICRRTTFENYGLKAVNGVNRISGPGTDSEKEPGMMQGGGRWPQRLATICGELIGEVDEYDIYKYILEHGEKNLHMLLCMNGEEEALNACGNKGTKDEL